jgi:hypothetical protein
MKQFLFVIFFGGLIFSGCSKEEEKLEAYNSQAFAYDIGDYWEVNASTRVKGFKQDENEGNYSASLAYDIHLVVPAGDTVFAMISRVEDKENNEAMMDVPIEIQFELDSTYAAGAYTVIFSVKDVNTEQTSFAAANFSLDEKEDL